MIRTIDRYILVTFFRAYLICFFSLVGLYVVIDAFTKLDEFARVADTFADLAQNLFTYYFFRTSLFFHRLYGVISLIAALFTLTWMKRHNEILPLLSCGISAYRVVAPVLLAAFVVNLLAMANQELIMPRISPHLQRAPDDPHRQKIKDVESRIDRNGVMLSGTMAEPAKKKIASMKVMIVPPLVPTGRDMICLSAQEGLWIDDGHRRGWRLVRTEPAQIADLPKVLTRIAPGEFFLASSVTFDTMTRSTQWYLFAPTAELRQACKDPSMPRHDEMLVLLHTRFTKVILNLILLFLGIPFVLNSHDRNVFLSLGICLSLCAAFYIVTAMTEHLGNRGAITAVQAAWAPVVVFSVISVALFDTIRT